MCGRFGLTRPDKLKLERFGITGIPDMLPRFNIPPSSEVLVVRERQGVREAGLCRWGLVPWWATSPTIGAKMANARSDTAFTKPAFRDAMAARRALIPADVFYEWQVMPGKGGKQPWAIALKGREPFAFGGLWEFWRNRGGEGEGLLTCTILTTEPNTLLGSIHDRMPVIVPPERYGTWLDPRTPEPALRELLVPYPSELMEVWPIGKGVNKTDADHAGLLERVEPSAPLPDLDLFG